MIELTRLDGRVMTLNADLIETVDANPDTLVRLVGGNSYIVRESPQEIVRRVIAYRRQVFRCAWVNEHGPQESEHTVESG